MTSEKIQDAYLDAALAGMAEHPIVLIPQDTTALNFSTQYKRKDAGLTTKDSSHGIYLHAAIAVTPYKVCLGALSSKQWHRKELQKLTRTDRNKKDSSLPIENKESYCWLENYHKANEYARRLPNIKIVSIADREGDIYSIYEEAQTIFSKKDAKAPYLIRAKTDRKVCTQEGKATENRIKSALKDETPRGHLTVEISGTKKRKSRIADLTIYSKKIHIGLPDKRKKEKNYNPVEITAILCVELNRPEAEKAIEWLLVTDLSVTTFEEAHEKIQWYANRWKIEVFFKVLKSGCAIEKLQLTEENFNAALSFYMIIAWRILYVVIMGRHSPDISCECVFSKEEWQTTYVVVHRKKPPTLNEMTRIVASLGGYINKKSNPEPGGKTMWIGLRNMQEHLKAKEAFEAVYGPTCG